MLDNENKDSDMKIKNILKYYLLGESLKNIKLDNISEKINKNKSLSDREKKFIDLYQKTKNNTNTKKDFMLLSKNSTSSIVKELLENDYKIICNLEDSNGRFGLLVTSIDNKFEEDKCTIYMKGNEKHNLEDRYLYNIIYNNKKDEYSLEIHDEYFEKIEVNNG